MLKKPTEESRPTPPWSDWTCIRDSGHHLTSLCETELGGRGAATHFEPNDR